MNVSGAANALRAQDLFRNVSLRLLDDLIELARAGVQTIQFGQNGSVSCAALIILEGEALWHKTSQVSDRVGVGSVLVTDRTDDSNFEMTGISPVGVRLLPISWNLVTRAQDGSPEFKRGFAAGLLRATAVAVTPGIAELIWMCREAGSNLPMLALTELLAAAVAEQFQNGGFPVTPTGIVLVGAQQVTLETWNGHSFVKLNSWPTTAPIPEQILIGALPALQPGQPFYRLYFVNPSNPNSLPVALNSVRLHRIVFLATRPVSSVSSALTNRLQPAVTNPTVPGSPYFSSVVPSIVSRTLPAGQPSAFPPLLSWLAKLGADLLGLPTSLDGFRSEPLDEAPIGPGGLQARPRRPLERDTCRLHLDLSAITQLWTSCQNQGASFPPAAFASQDLWATAWRWARATTNQRPGLAVSGGGASAYRVVPLIRLLHWYQVPIDVMGGNSGGAMIAAYYCSRELAGLQQAVTEAGTAGLAGLLTLLSSEFIELSVNWRLGGVTLDDLEVRFLPVTTALPPLGPPEASAVVGGTIGAAVRASGSLPGIFARTVKGGTIFTDGSTATPLPVRALPNYGADLVFACNAIPGPDRCNPIRSLPGGELLYRWTPIGRILDSWVSNTFLVERIGNEAGASAAVFVQPLPNNASLIEIFRWDQASEIVDKSSHDAHVLNGGYLCFQAWRTFTRKS
jgi:predicted acylesterase/phospholipase RssA